MNRIRSIGRLGLLAAWAVAAATLRTAPAAITVQDGVPWVYQVNDGGATILHGPGCGDVTIPAQLDCYPVRGIGTNAFSGCTGLTGMTLPDSVTSIGNNAFSGCTGLATLLVPVGLAGTTYVGNSGVPSSCTVLYGDAWEKVDGATWSYVVHDGTATVTAGPREGAITIPSVLGGHPVTGIGNNAFYQCRGLTSVTIPDSVTSIGGGAFVDCSGLLSVTIPDSVTSIGDSAFAYCSGLLSVTIGDSVTSIGGSAFDGCRGLTSVTIPDSVTSIGEAAFYECSGLTAVHIHDLAAWCGIEFGDYSANPHYYARHLYLCGEEVAGDLVIPDGVARIGSYAFYSCTNLTSVTIPDSVTSIGSSAFSGCSGLTAVHIHDLAAWCGIEFWSPSANPLDYARHLYLDGKEVAGDLVIPDGVAKIGGYAFYNCTNLTSVTIPDSVTSIGDEAFYECRGLTSVTISDSVTSIGGYAFYGCSGLTSVTIPDSVTSIGDSAFSWCRGLTNMTVGVSVTNIGWWMVEGCSQLATMNVPEAWRSLYVNGMFWSYCAGVPSGCEIVYYAPATPGVTATGVPYGWLEEKAGEALAAAGGDYEAAAKAAAANGRAVWECYVAGLDPGDAEKDFTTAISFADGVPEVSWNPDLNEGGTKSARSYVVEGKPAMADEWDATNSASRFFRVKVELPKP